MMPLLLKTGRTRGISLVKAFTGSSKKDYVGRSIRLELSRLLGKEFLQSTFEQNQGQKPWRLMSKGLCRRNIALFLYG
jgi:hypothetical protein